MSRPPRPPVLPMRDGVCASSLGLPGGRPPVGLLLDQLCQRLPTLDRAAWRDRMAAGEVVDAQGRALPPDTPALAGQRIHYWREPSPEPPLSEAPRILHQDEHLLVADKPHGMPVAPVGTHVQRSLLVWLRRETGLPDLSPLHRIDRDTAGLVLFAVTRESRHPYQHLFAERHVHKVYEAIAPWLDLPAQGLTHRSRIDADAQHFYRRAEVPGEPNSESRIRCLGRLARDPTLARYALEPLTGRTHQLRLHMLALGAPIVGDPYYPEVRRGPHDAEAPGHPLQLLARTLRVDDPFSQQRREFHSRRSLLLAP